MKKGLILVLTLMLVLSVAVTALAVDPGGFVLNTVITPASTEATPILVEQGQTVLLTATTTSSAGVIFYVSEAWTGAAVVTPASGSGEELVSTANFSSNQLGKHTVTYTITVHRGNSHVTGTSGGEAYLEVETINGEITVIVEPMAAPAVAAQILKFNGVQPRYGNARTGGSFIADVAHKMGPQTMFDGVPKEVWSNDAEGYVSNPAYWTAVLSFLNNHEKTDGGLLCAYDWFKASLE